MIDAYTLLASRLDLAAGDKYHWQGAAYQLLTDEIAGRVKAALKAAKE